MHHLYNNPIHGLAETEFDDLDGLRRPATNHCHVAALFNDGNLFERSSGIGIQT